MATESVSKSIDEMTIDELFEETLTLGVDECKSINFGRGQVTVAQLAHERRLRNEWKRRIDASAKE